MSECAPRNRQVLAALSSSDALNEAAQQVVELRGMFPVGKVAGAIENVHTGIGGAAGDQIEQRLALIDGRGGIVVRPGKQCGQGEAAITNPTQGFILLAR